jgi:Family of unknown function (DUF6510)
VGGEALWLDGNAIAGVLADAFGAEMTAAPHRCQSCGAVNAVAAHRLYRGAGLVLRCPACADVALRIGVRDDALVFEWRGTFTGQRPQ